MDESTERTGWRAHPVALIVGGLLAVAVAAWVAFGFFGVQTLFSDDEVDEEGPVFASGATVPATGTGDDAEATTDSPTTASAAPATGATDGSTPPTTAAAAPQVEVAAEGSFVARSHPAEGRAVVLTDGTQRFLRFEDFATDNGPDLFVYLSKGTTADSPEDAFDDDFVDLGVLKGNVGDQNYEVPADVDLSEYTTVVIWCRRFTVAFGAADLVTPT